GRFQRHEALVLFHVVARLDHHLDHGHAMEIADIRHLRLAHVCHCPAPSIPAKLQDAQFRAFASPRHVWRQPEPKVTVTNGGWQRGATAGRLRVNRNHRCQGADAMLTIRNLSKTYPNGVQALRDVSLDVPNGMFGLLGPNGAGKSTLMRTIATLQDPDEGSLKLGDIDVLADKPATRRVLGYLPQEFGVYPKVSAEAMLDHFAVLKGVTRRGERRDLIDALLKQVNLWDVRRRKLGGFSGGMRQRFGIAQALIGDPKLVIVDEPTAGLDPEERQRFLNLLAEIGERVVVILSTHIVEDVTELCPRMA